MNENYIVINGKKAELTEKQLKALGIEVETKRKNPFERVPKGERYFFTTSDGANVEREANDGTDDNFFENVDYFNDRDFAHQVALHQLLYRKLLKFAYDNECEDTAEWGTSASHWLIIYHTSSKAFTVAARYDGKEQTVYFSTEEGAKRAIKEVVEPFMEQHPDFMW